MSDYYAILTGSKNNAGDFLIKYRAKQLLVQIRPDREIVDLHGWQPFDDETLDVVNNSRGLLLTGGPALQEKMRPRVYGLVDDLAEIKVPIITMGVGWYSQQGDWRNTHKYFLNKASRELLDRIASDGYLSSVRDYHTLNVLTHMGYDNYLMTGCPALYSTEHLGQAITAGEVRKVAFSLGVGMKTSRRMERQMRSVIQAVSEVFGDGKTCVVFHHGLSDNYLKAAGATRDLYEANRRMADWLDSRNIPFVDISGSAENLINFYSEVDLHIGYRVHAHIFMSSISKPSILLSEDGRGKALGRVLGGACLDAYEKVYHNKFISALHRLGVRFDNIRPADCLKTDLETLLNYEISTGVRLAEPRANIDRHFQVMNKFLKALP